MKTFIRPTTEAYLVGSTFHFEGVWLVSCRLSAWPASVCPSQMLLLRSYPLRVWECCGTAHCRLSSWSSTQLCTSCSMRPWRGGWDEKDARWEQVKKAPRQRIRIKMSEWLYGSLGYVAFHCVGSSNLYWPCKAVFILGFLSQISSAEIFVIGAIAKAIAATSTYPLQTVQTILRVKTNMTHIFSCWQKPLTDNSWCRYECFHWPDQDSIQRWLASGSICLLQVEQKRCLTLCHLSWQIFTTLGRKGDSPVLWSLNSSGSTKVAKAAWWGASGTFSPCSWTESSESVFGLWLTSEHSTLDGCLNRLTACLQEVWALWFV